MVKRLGGLGMAAKTEGSKSAVGREESNVDSGAQFRFQPESVAGNSTALLQVRVRFHRAWAEAETKAN